MSRHDYEIGREPKLKDASFYGIIMGAMMRADTHNAGLLRSQWPDVWDEVQARYDAPGARLPTDPDFRSEPA